MTTDRPYQVALLTGPSDWGRCALSPVQHSFLHTLDVPDDALILSNFPYRSGTPPYRPVPLLKASLSNGVAYMRSRSRRFQGAYFPPMERVLARAEHTVFIIGSCGLELFNNLQLPDRLLERISVFAYGPVGRRRPRCRHRLVSGRQDRMSRLCFPTPDDTVDCSHLEYLRNSCVRVLCSGFIANAIHTRSPLTIAP